MSDASSDVRSTGTTTSKNRNEDKIRMTIVCSFVCLPVCCCCCCLIVDGVLVRVSRSVKAPRYVRNYIFIYCKKLLLGF